MLSYLNPKDGPVIEGHEEEEIIYATDQLEYKPLRTLVGADKQRRVLSHWEPTPEQRKAIAEGADIYLQLLTFGQPLQPILMFISNGMEDWEKISVGVPVQLSNG